MSRLVLTALAVASFAACELEEITVVDVEEVVLAEVYANVATDFADNQLLAFLHQTLGSEDVDAAEAGLVGARITVRRPSDGLIISLRNAAITDCIEEDRDDLPEACFLADSLDAARLRPRDLLTLEVDLVDGGRMEGETRVPGDFELPGFPTQCRLAPDTLLPILWTSAEGAWAYINETAISGLPDAVRSEGIIFRDDPLYLLGLSISATDTTTTFPSEFGVFNRFDLDQQLAVRLQRGLPADVSAEITVTAVDRNYVNWARGGNFNPSGQVRVPSLRGDGSGVFGSTVGRRILLTTSSGSGLPACALEGG
ncbi:MAG: hypothetical protein HKN72_03905 [Gemmatimonadetes bacterium]|nr:hypothetical protein [Gemmatimonadota bacterium]NNF12338.1 hypothetical protein [Gemmatimonadota bacterium]NNL31234.1 hypothetical protein [Gemmatimonadota bacterium]